MLSPIRKLDAWVEAGLISTEQRAAIMAHESDSSDAPPTLSVAEALGYIGAALAFGAVGLVVRGVWQNLLPEGRIGLALAAVLVFGASAYLLEARSSETSQRLTSVLTAVTVLSLLAVVGLASDEFTDFGSESQAALLAVTYAVSVAVAYARRPRALFVVMLFSSGVALIGAVLAQPAVTVNVFAAAMLFWVFALSWLLLTVGGWVMPRRPALIVGAIGGVIALQVARVGSMPLAPLLLGLLTAGVLVWFALRIHDQIILVIAAITVFVFVPQLSFLVFADSLGAAGALFVSGLVLVIGAALSTRLRRQARDEAPSAVTDEGTNDVF